MGLKYLLGAVQTALTNSEAAVDTLEGIAGRACTIGLTARIADKDMLEKRMVEVNEQQMPRR